MNLQSADCTRFVLFCKCSFLTAIIYLTNTDQDKPMAGQVGADIRAGVTALEKWMDEWNWLEDGYPGDGPLVELVSSILASARVLRPDESRKSRNLASIQSKLLTISSRRETV